MDSEPDAFMGAFDLASFVHVGATDMDLDCSGNASGSVGSCGLDAGSAPIQLDGFDLGNAHQQQQPSQHAQHQQHQLHHQQGMNIGELSMYKNGETRRAHALGGRAHGQAHDDDAMMAAGAAQANGVNMDTLQQLLGMQMQMHFPMDSAGGGAAPSNPLPPNSSTAALLEQQLRLNQLQQLQQLQNQIFQQQIELISGQSSLSSSLEGTPLPGSAFRDNQNQFHGLPTPLNSTELRAQPPPNFVSPMILQNFMAPSSGTLTNPNHIPQGSSSAPAHLAFHTHTPLPSPCDLDFELSPLTSPWLGAYQQPEQQVVPARTLRRGSKRGASSSGDDVAVQARKRQSPVVRATAGGGPRRTTSTRGSTSLSSTPALRARSRKNSTTGDVVGDSPSPVDLSMPPPAPPSQTSGVVGESSQAAQQQQSSASASPSASRPSPTLSPVTPASIMNLGRLGLSSGLSPPLNADTTPQQNVAQGKGKSKALPKLNVPGAASTTAIAKASKKTPTSATSTSAPLISPSLKPLLPGGLPPSSAAHLAAASNYMHHLAGSASALNISPGTPLPLPAPAVRKTSHKAAEQKRRDSLKTSFDALRLLLPPLPLPSDEGYVGEPPLPGAMPPRGPPRGDVAGPNRAVSKLQLLRCGNDFIRRLKERVTRRDEYIEQLKAEVRLLRARVEEDASGDAGGDVDVVAAGIQRVDLEKDLDAEEANAPRLGGALIEGDEADEEGCE